MEWEYKIIEGNMDEVEEQPNRLAKEGWAPAFYQVAGSGGAGSHYVILRRQCETLETPGGGG